MSVTGLRFALLFRLEHKVYLTNPLFATHVMATQKNPPGKTKIMAALVQLLGEKEFEAITWSEIARTAGVNEGLIYKYFKTSRNLLHEVLKEYLTNFKIRMETALKGIEGAINKLRRLVWIHFDLYNSNRVLAKILLLEVRNSPEYFQSDTYKMIQYYGGLITELVEEGVQSGELRKGIEPRYLRQVILGSVEHLSLTSIVYNRKLSPDELTTALFDLLFHTDPLRQK